MIEQANRKYQNRALAVLACMAVLCVSVAPASSAAAADRLVDQYGEPVAGAMVRLEIDWADGSGPQTIALTTDEQGSFARPSQAGSYRLTDIQKPGYRLTGDWGADLVKAYTERLKKVRDRQEKQRIERETAQKAAVPGQAKRLPSEQPVYAADYAALTAQAAGPESAPVNSKRAQPVEHVIYRQLEPADLVFKAQDYTVSINDVSVPVKEL